MLSSVPPDLRILTLFTRPDKALVAAGSRRGKQGLLGEQSKPQSLLKPTKSLLVSAAELMEPPFTGSFSGLVWLPGRDVSISIGDWDRKGEETGRGPKGEMLDHLRAGTDGVSWAGVKVDQAPEKNTAISLRMKDETKPERVTVTATKRGPSSWYESHFQTEAVFWGWKSQIELTCSPTRGPKVQLNYYHGCQPGSWLWEGWDLTQGCFGYRHMSIFTKQAIYYRCNHETSLQGTFMSPLSPRKLLI